MQGLNLSKFKKVKGDKNVSVLKHPDGHEIRVFHAALKPEQRKAMAKMPIHLAEGGDAEEETSDFTPPSVTDLPTTPIDPSSPQGMASMSTQDMLSQAKQNMAPIPDSPQPTDATSTDSTPADAPKSGAAVPGVAGYDQTLQGLAQQRDVNSKLAAQQADIQKSDIDAKQDLLDGLKKNSAHFQEQQQAFLQDLQNSHIDPKHYQESMSSAQKVGTAIGLFLGGWSSGYTHQGNPALEFLNHQIDRDIEAQKANLDNKKTLLGANQAMYQDSILANNATRAQMNDIYLAKMKQAADALGTPQALAQYNLAAGKFKLENAGLLQQNAIRATVLHSAQEGGQGLDAQSLAAAGLMSPQEAEKEQSSIEAQKKAIEATKHLFTELDKEQSTSNLLNPQSYRRRDQLKAELVNAVMNASASKRLTRESIEAEIDPLLIKTRDTDETRTGALNGMLNIIGRHADPTPNMSKYAPKAVPQYPFNAPMRGPK